MRPLIETGDPHLKSYLKGFVLAVALTLIPFALALWKLIPELLTLAAIAALAVVQMTVHLRYFLHVDLSAVERANLLALIFAGIIIFIFVGGTLWIMFNLHYRMMV